MSANVSIIFETVKRGITILSTGARKSEPYKPPPASRSTVLRRRKLRELEQGRGGEAQMARASNGFLANRAAGYLTEEEKRRLDAEVVGSPITLSTGKVVTFTQGEIDEFRKSGKTLGAFLREKGLTKEEAQELKEKTNIAYVVSDKTETEGGKTYRKRNIASYNQLTGKEVGTTGIRLELSDVDFDDFWLDNIDRNDVKRVVATQIRTASDGSIHATARITTSEGSYEAELTLNSLPKSMQQSATNTPQFARVTFYNAKKNALAKAAAPIRLEREEYAIFRNDAFTHQERLEKGVGYANTYTNFYIFDIDEDYMPVPRFQIPINDENRELIRRVVAAKTRRALSGADAIAAERLGLHRVNNRQLNAILFDISERTKRNGINGGLVEGSAGGQENAQRRTGLSTSDEQGDTVRETDGGRTQGASGINFLKTSSGSVLGFEPNGETRLLSKDPKTRARAAHHANTKEASRPAGLPAGRLVSKWRRPTLPSC